MRQKTFPPRDSQKVQKATLCFLLKKRKVLLAMKKRGFGVGLWNGVGGKTNDKETLEKAAVRETKEEIGVIPKRLSRVATLHFFFPDDPQKFDWNQDVYVFITKSWSGIPQESEEMNPRWFDFNEIPYHTMWADDAVWLPKVLKGFKVEGWFLFDEENRMVDYKLKVLK